MKVAFLTETNYNGKWPASFPNCRTEIAWQIALNSDHYNIHNYRLVKGYDHVFIIFPKGDLNLNLVGGEVIKRENPSSIIFSSNITDDLKQYNKKVYFIQEGPVYLFNDYSLVDQFNYYNQLQNCDILFAHNSTDMKWYSGLFPEKKVSVIPTLMIEDLIKTIPWKPTNKVMIGGNFARWYGGFQSYIVASVFNAEMWIQTSHASREGEDQIPDLKILPRVTWLDWIGAISTFKYAVNMMPTVAAGTFSLNNAYFGIPCIANEKLDTQRLCHPMLSVSSEDVNSARNMAELLRDDKQFYDQCSMTAREMYFKHFRKEMFLEKIYKTLE